MRVAKRLSITNESVIDIRDKDYDFSVDLSLISIAEKEPFRGVENESVVEPMNKLSTLSSLLTFC